MSLRQAVQELQIGGTSIPLAYWHSNARPHRRTDAPDALRTFPLNRLSRSGEAHIQSISNSIASSMGRMFRREGQHSMASACVPKPGLRQSRDGQEIMCGMSQKDGFAHGLYCTDSRHPSVGMKQARAPLAKRSDSHVPRYLPGYL